MAKRFIIVTLFAFPSCLHSRLYAMVSEEDDSSKIVKLANTINRFNKVFPQEKVYLHFDNTGYYIGETIWFKAYMQTSDKTGLGSKSKVLYVELLDPSGNVVISKKLKINGGTAHGNIRLDELPLSGFYEVRAYTRYMLNWGKEAIFTRVFPVFARPKTDGDYNKKVLEQDVADKYLPSKAVDPMGKSSDRIVRFYPEGGQLVAGLTSRVAFECLDGKGKPLNIKGWLVKDGKRISEVSTGKDGRGVFYVSCGKDGKSAFSLEFVDGRRRIFKLPDVVAEGAVMTVDTGKDDSIRWTVRVTEGLRRRLLGQLFIHNGNMYKCNIVHGAANGAVARKDMASGVNQIALTDTAGNVFCDRLVFVYPKQGGAGKIDVSTSDSVIWPGKHMTMNLKACRAANVSMTVCDALTQTGGWTHNAATWMLLTSDLKGYINHPEYYFESDDEEHRRSADLLMMVQGWRRHNVKMMEGKEVFVKKYPVEDRLYIDGQLKQKKAKNTVDGVELGILLSNEQGDQIAGETETNEKGFYAFSVPDCYRQWYLAMSTRKKDKDVDYYITIDRQFSPDVDRKSWFQLNPTDSVRPSFSFGLSKQYEELLPMDMKIHWLRNVDVYGQRKWKSPRQYWERENRGAAHSIVRYDCQREADKIADGGELMPTLEEWLKQENKDFAGAEILAGTSNYDGYNDIDVENNYQISADNDREIMLYKTGDTKQSDGKERSFHSEGLTYKNRPIMWIVDNSFFGGTGFNSLRGLPEDVRDKMKMALHTNFPTFLDDARSVYVSVKPDDWMRFVDLPELMGRQYVTVYVYSFMNAKFDRKGLRVTKFDGYDMPDEYEQIMTLDNPATVQDDYRRTLYWNPNVQLNADGKAKIRFTTNSTCRYITVSAEGFTVDGKPLTYY